jgi:phosphatidylethanolamine/phosphatidyl-N-methylethanolamine N-methyltransferase
MTWLKRTLSKGLADRMEKIIPLNNLAARKSTDLTRRRYNRIAAFYDQMEWFIEKNVFSDWRSQLWDQIEADKVLEIGVGTGKNLPYYPANLNLTAVDLSEGMMTKALTRAEKFNHLVDFRLMDVESLTFRADSFDAAVATFVFCSVPDPVKGLRELGRVVKPGGDIWLLDHVRVNKPIIGPLMDIFNPLAVRMMGANINRRTKQNVQLAGLKIHSITYLKGELVQLIHAGPGQ